VPAGGGFRFAAGSCHTLGMTTHLVSRSRSAARSNRLVIALTVGGAVAGTMAGLAADAGTSAVAAGAVLGALATGAGWPDLCERRIPNRVVLAGLVATAALALVVAVGGDRPVLGSVVAGGVVAGGTMLALHLARPASLGFGDVKLATVVGALLGMVHWSLAAVMLAVASVAGAAGALAVREWRRSIPFGTCMGVAALVAFAATPFLRDRVGLW
jgi:leader peptidase (prepilin peptidase)/N-methyltransferase